MSWLWDTIAGRTILILVVGLTFSLAVSQLLYQRGLERELRESNAVRLADRLLVLRRTLTRVPRGERDDTAHTLSGGPIELHWSPEPLAIAGGQLDSMAQRLREVVLERASDLSDKGLVMGTSQIGGAETNAGKSHGTDHITLISMALPDGSWLNLSLAQVAQTSIGSPSFLATALLLAGAIVILAALMGRWLTRPLLGVADGARQLFAGAQNIEVPEKGTREVRDLAVAFNEMQARIARLIGDRTDMLAAISHDLRTPLTRLRLRAERIGDRKTQSEIEADLDEMEGMLDATLAFLRGDKSDEDVRPVDVAAILQTIANDFEDAGEEISFQANGRAVVDGRSNSLKRALTNLVQNAVKHGGSAAISVTERDANVIVAISDHGPGIAPAQLENVFSPFVRLDPARGRQIGGYGLGLTVARSLIRMHGGDVQLSNRSSGGLEAKVSLPTTTRAIPAGQRQFFTRRDALSARRRLRGTRLP
jgi:two-component system OmpR family sensor kinase